MKTNRFVGGLIVMLVVTSCTNGSNNPQKVSKPEYTVMSVAKQDANLQSVYPATIKGQEDIEIRPRIDGFIDAIYVDEGAAVTAGQVLFKINSPSTEQALTSAKASVSRAKAEVNTAKVDVERIRPLAEKGIISEVQLLTYKNAYESALASLEQANASLKSAQAAMGWTKVTSPVSGVVGSIPFRKGSLVNSTNILTTIANTSNVYAYFSLNEKSLMAFLNNLDGATQSEKIKNIPSVSLLLADGSEYSEKGRVETITGSVDVTTGSANFRAKFPNKAGILRSGSSGKVVIPRIMTGVYVIPQKATFNQQDKVVVYRVQGDSAVQKIIQVVPMPDGQNYAVISGLADGDRIVTDGVATLSNGKKIAVKGNGTQMVEGRVRSNR